MAFPVVAEAVESSTNTAGTSHVVTLPTATANQLLLIILDKGSTAATINAHTELTELLDENSANGLYIAYRWMNGSEPASYTLTSSASTRSATIAYRISGAVNPATQAPQIGTTASGSSATPDPPASAAPGSTKDYLFIAFYGAAGEEADDDTWSDTPPTSYTPSPPRQKSCGIAGTNLGGLIAAAERQLNTGSAQDPGTFAKDVSAAWRAQTILVSPAEAQQFTASFAATAVGVPSRATDATFLRAFVATAVGVATLSAKVLFQATFATVATGVATLGIRLAAAASFAATAVGIATVTARATFKGAFAAVVVGVAALSTVFTPGGGGGPGIISRSRAAMHHFIISKCHH